MAGKKLPYTTISPDFLEPRDPILGFIKIGGKADAPRIAASGKPWVPPTRFIDPPRFEVTTREKMVKKFKPDSGKKKGQEFKVDMGFKRDDAFHKAIESDHPTTLAIRLLYPEPEQNIITFLGAHSGKRWECRGDGTKATDMKRGECMCPCPRLDQFEGEYKGTPPNDGWDRKPDYLHKCKPRATLMVLLEGAEVFGGFWAFKTTSYNSISNMLKTLQLLREMFGRVDGLPLELRVQAATLGYGDGQTTQPIVNIVLAASMNTARQIASDAAAESRKYLPAGGDEELDAYREVAIAEMQAEGEEYAGEFDPDSVDPDGPAGAVDDEGPDHEIVTDDEDNSADISADKSDPQSDDEAPESPNDGGAEAAEADMAADIILQETARLVRACLAKLDDWDTETINDRVQFHIRKGNLDALRDRCRDKYPEQWAEVIAATMEEEKDDLPF